MRYQVPQFIEIEDKIFGPFTFKQFTYLVGGAGLSAVIWFTAPTFLRFFLVAPVVLLALALAFYTVNNKPFLFIFLSAIKYFSSPKLYVWKKPAPRKIQDIEEDVSFKKLLAPVPKVSEGKLRDVAWSLGVKDSIYSTPETERTSKVDQSKSLVKDAQPQDNQKPHHDSAVEGAHGQPGNFGAEKPVHESNI